MTRLVSRYVMRRNYQSPHVEGPAATIRCPTGLQVKLPVKAAFLLQGIIGMAREREAITKQTSTGRP
ncbi:hypothetical protein [Bradyrhizobium elkanii]|uniref:Uncharacterized protein n=1 Tax=Bradyrhizobium elkanii TaxID=29448 RepID=A0A8I2C4C8_BRAEL|nr:hypothetical protein [Bradyrhizobium elkanii]MBP1297440.1 hypothetical protein [Bradyrhizobium elkanii]